MLERETLRLNGEKQFKLLDYNPSGLTEEELRDNCYPIQLTIHPWARKNGKERIDREVFLSIETTDPKAQGDTDVMNTIVDRDEFIDGILYAFPELQYREDYE